MIANKRLEKILVNRNKLLCEPILKKLVINKAYLERPYREPFNQDELKNKQDQLMESIRSLLNYDFCKISKKSSDNKKTSTRTKKKTEITSIDTEICESEKLKPSARLAMKELDPRLNKPCVSRAVKKNVDSKPILSLRGDESKKEEVISKNTKDRGSYEDPKTIEKETKQPIHHETKDVKPLADDVEEGELSSDEEPENSKLIKEVESSQSKKRPRSRSRSRGDRKHHRRDSRSPSCRSRRNRSPSPTPLKNSNRYNSNNSGHGHAPSHHRHNRRDSRSKSRTPSDRYHSNRHTRSRSRNRYTRGNSSRSRRSRSRSKSRHMRR